MGDAPLILVADDRADSVELCRDLLIMEGYRVVAAFNGQEALDQIHQHNPDLVLLDVGMPLLNGYQVCERLKANAATADIPVLMLTAWAAPEQRVMGLQLGAEDYVAKPFDYRELLARVQARLRAKREADCLRQAQQAIRDTFERFVPPHVVERLLADPASVSLGGRLQAVTVLFADLRGYTTLAEMLPPEQLVEVLNGHLTAAARAILAYEGTVCQFAGDQVMAIFNAPLPQPDHASRAMRAAWALQEAIAIYHGTLPAHLRMRFGIGIASGNCLVGNVGAIEQLHYTAVGDTVNLAQRLEEMAGGSEILITENCLRAAPAEVKVKARGTTAIRGRNEPVSIFSLLSVPDEQPRPQATQAGARTG